MSKQVNLDLLLEEAARDHIGVGQGDVIPVAYAVSNLVVEEVHQVIGAHGAEDKRALSFVEDYKMLGILPSDGKPDITVNVCYFFFPSVVKLFISLEVSLHLLAPFDSFETVADRSQHRIQARPLKQVETKEVVLMTEDDVDLPGCRLVFEDNGLVRDQVEGGKRDFQL